MVDIVGIGLAVDSKDVVKGTANLKKLGEQGKKTETAADKMSKSFKMLGGIIATIGVVALTKNLISQMNTYTALNNKLKLVTTSKKNLADVEKMLFDIAQETRGSLEGTIDLYSRLARSTRDLGLSQNELGEVTETINQAIAVSGATANEASAALFQLGQGLSAGALRGEELNSVMEQTPRLAQAIADGLGVEIAGLREMGAAGELNSQKVIGALQNQADAISKEFGKTEKTVAQAFIQIKNVALLTFGALDSRELVDSMDEFRKIISDPEIIAGLQGIAKLLVQIVTLAVKTAAAVGSIYSSLVSSVAGAANRTEIEKLNERILKTQEELARTDNELYAKVLTDSLERYKIELAALTEADAAKKAVKDGGGGGATGGMGGGEDDEKLDLEFAKLALETDLILEQMAADDARKLEQKQDYWNRLYNMEAGAQQAAANFSKAIRDGDAKNAVKNGALMLADSAKNSKAMFEVQKAFSLANAVVALPSAVLKSFENGGGYPWGLVPAGLMLAQGLQQIQSINSAQFGGGTSTASVGGSTSSSAPVASGLPSGSTAVEDASEQSQGTTTINLVGEDKTFSSDQIDSLFGEIGDALERGDRVLFSSTSRQALELTA